MNSEHPLNQKKIALIKALGLLLLVIFFFALLSKTMLSGGQTLSEYAEQHTQSTDTLPSVP